VQRYQSLLIAVGLGLLACLAILGQRWSLEARSRTIEIVLDGADWEALGARGGQDAAAFLNRARSAGATSIAVLERTLKRLAEQGVVAYVSSGDLLAGQAAGTLPPAWQDVVRRRVVHPRAVYITGTAATLNFLEEAYRGLLGASRVSRLGRVLQVTGTREDIEEIGVGFVRQDLAKYTAIGLQPVLRLRNYSGLTVEGLKDLFARLRRQGTGYTIVFELQEVLGTDALIPETAKEMRAGHYRYGRIEVFNIRRKQRGEEILAKHMRPEVIRLFSLTPDELSQLTVDEARDKYVLAARERNIRLLYVRPINVHAGVVSTDANLSYIAEMAKDLRRFGLRTGRAEPLAPLRVSSVLLAIASLAALGALGLVVDVFADAVGVRVPAAGLWATIGGGVFITLVLALTGHSTLWRKLLALGVAATVPAVATAWTLPRVGSGGSVLWRSLKSLWSASAIAVLTGLVVAALLSSWDFMMAADQFLGVKIAQIIPVVLVVILQWAWERPQRSWRLAGAEIWAWASRPLVIWHAIVVVSAGLAVGILLGRSGNLGLPVLGAEARLRTVTENLLVARPRTKEYLIGHPAFMLAAAAAIVGWRRAVLPLAAIGVIGQAGIVNSFSHIHTPLLYALWRTINALILGSILGGVASAVMVAVLRRIRRALESDP
jgi:hypothetical protein